MSVAGLAGSSDFSFTDATVFGFAAQVVRLHNANAASQSAGLVDEKGNPVTVVLGPGESYHVYSPITSVDSSECGSDISALAYYWV